MGGDEIPQAIPEVPFNALLPWQKAKISYRQNNAVGTLDEIRAGTVKI